MRPLPLAVCLLSLLGAQGSAAANPEDVVIQAGHGNLQAVYQAGGGETAILFLPAAEDSPSDWLACSERALTSAKTSALLPKEQAGLELLEAAARYLLAQEQVEHVVLVALGDQADKAVSLAGRVDEIAALALLTPELSGDGLAQLRASPLPVLLLASSGDPQAVERLGDYVAQGAGPRITAIYPSSRPVVGARLVGGHFTVPGGQLTVTGSEALFSWALEDACQEFMCYPADTIAQFVLELEQARRD